LPDLTAVVEARGADADVLLARGMIYAASRNHQAAVADFTAAVRARPGFAKAHWERGKSYLALGDRAGCRVFGSLKGVAATDFSAACCPGRASVYFLTRRQDW